MELTAEVVDALRAVADKLEEMAEITGDKTWEAASRLVHREIGNNNPCEFTFSHTSNWCGHPGCRRS